MAVKQELRCEEWRRFPAEEGDRDIGELQPQIAAVRVQHPESTPSEIAFRRGSEHHHGECFGVGFLFCMALFSQESKPPQNPGRFTMGNSYLLPFNQL